MADLITLPREVLEQAYDYIDSVPDDRYNAEHIDHEALVAALRTALEAPEVTTTIDIHPDLADALAQQAAPAAPKEEPDALGLFHNQAHTDLGPATRLKAAPAAREPLSDEQILMTLRPEVWEHVEGHYKTQMLTDARAIEAAHGIGKL